ncbi:carbohydrate sulfotransferase 12-like isoform X2 [Mercenaria mercenaria]|uniref:carbohydrate sulfotransferase 12-like isoform X2 n=1 Tax=Mercenaria mercenaria TaxID=6596 RepID=UPI001E1E067E|nr:carbohydrate sulfotransferase 12-like isoform X2 [Mercenaria mercenaria]
MRVRGKIVLTVLTLLIMWTVLSKDSLTSTLISQPTLPSPCLKFGDVTGKVIGGTSGVVNIKENINTSSERSKGSMDQENDIHRRFINRKRHLQNVCSKVRETRVDQRCIRNGVASNLKYVENKEMLFCAIEKTGSTFWKRILHIAGGWRNVSNPTHIGLGEAYTEKGGYRSMKGKNWTNIVEIFSKTRSVIFVRDPYTRLFSGWLDKFYSPNTYFWKSAGKQIVKKERKTDVKCGYDVTFAEFVNHTVHNVLSTPCIDGHFQSNYLHCLPCNVTFDYIGKYETIKEDTMHILEAFKLSEKIKFDDFEKDSALDAIKDAAGWVFSQKKGVAECEVSFGCALFKVWSRLQSRGIISFKIKFPFKSDEDVRNVTRKQFESALKNAYDGSDSEDLQNSRQAALVQALGSLPKSSVNLIQQAFDLDFEIFGYDRVPIVSINPTNFQTFSYFQNCPPF